MKDAISNIFDAVNAATTIADARHALDAAGTLDAAGQADFLRRLRTEFATCARRQEKGIFTVIDVEPLDRGDLKQGFRILYNEPPL